MRRLIIPLAGLLAHQFKRVQDDHPTMFPAGWREISSYTFGYICVWEITAWVMHWLGAKDEEVHRYRHAGLQSAVLFGGGVAIGWMIDGALSLRGLVDSVARRR